MQRDDNIEEDPQPEIYNNQITNIEHTNESIDEREEAPYPWDPEKIRVDTKSFSIVQVMTMIKDKDLELAPDFQRKRVWDNRQKSSLIESILLRIPIPVFYFSSDNKGMLQVVDGLQRLSTIHDFMNDKLALTDMRYLIEINNKKMTDLDITWQRRIKTTQLVVNVIDPQTPPKVKFDIFRRINTGGVPLTEQEIRHCLSTPENRKLLEDMSKNKFFYECTGGKLDNDTRMLDRELVLRFCALMITEKKIFGEINEGKKFTGYPNLTSYLDDINELINSKLTSKQLKTLINYWETSCENAYNVFKDQAYTKMTRRLFNKAAFECISVEMAFCDKDKVMKNITQIETNYRKLLKNNNFFDSLSSFTHNSGRFNLRFKCIRKMLENYR